MEQRSGNVAATATSAGDTVFVGTRQKLSSELRIWQIAPNRERRRIASVEAPKEVVPLLTMTAWAGAACSGASRRGIPAVVCWVDHRWEDQGLPAVAGSAINQLIAVRGSLYALLINVADPSLVRITRFDGTSWTDLPSVPRGAPSTIAFLGRSARADRLLVGTTARNGRRVYGLRDGSWHRLAQGPGAGLPNQNSGPVQTDRAILFASSRIGADGWPFRIQHARRNGMLRNSRSFNNAGTRGQGVLELVERTPWALWQEARLDAAQREVTTVAASRLSSEGGSAGRTVLADFPSFGPISLTLVGFRGFTFGLFTQPIGSPPAATRVSLIRLAQPGS